MSDISTVSIKDDELSADEQAYFKSKGTKEPPASAPEPKEEASAPEPAKEEPASEPETPETKAEGGEEPASGDDAEETSVTGEKKVNFGALKEERNRRKDLEKTIDRMKNERDAQIQAERIREAKINERLMALQERMGGDPPKPKGEEKPGIPDPEENFIEAQKWTMQKILEREKADEAARTQSSQAQQQRQYQEQIVNTYGSAVAEAAKEHPVLAEAYRYLTNQRYNELIASGVAPDAAQRQARAEEFRIAESCHRDRVHPADRIMAISMARGFNPKVEPASGGAPAPARLDAIAEGQARNKTLTGTGTGGAPRGGAVDMKRLAEMSDDEFSAFFEKSDPKLIKKAMAG